MSSPVVSSRVELKRGVGSHSMIPKDYDTKFKPTWCPGCGDFGIWGSLKNALAELNLAPHEFVMVYGIGCSGNMTNFVYSYGLHSLHGRALPNARAIKMANHNLPVICIVGDGDTYGEGLHHLLNTVRANHDILCLVHDNQIYGLTTGQASPTSQKGFVSKSTPGGAFAEPINPLALVLDAGGTFVARGFSAELEHLKNLIVAGVKHKGFAFIDVFQPCVTFNKVNTYPWFRERVYKLEETQGYDPTNKKMAQGKAWENEKLPIGVLYKEDRPAYHENLFQLKEKPLVEQALETDISELVQEFK